MRVRALVGVFAVFAAGCVNKQTVCKEGYCEGTFQAYRRPEQVIMHPRGESPSDGDLRPVVDFEFKSAPLMLGCDLSNYPFFRQKAAALGVDEIGEMVESNIPDPKFGGDGAGTNPDIHYCHATGYMRVKAKPQGAAQ